VRPVTEPPVLAIMPLEDDSRLPETPFRVICRVDCAPPSPKSDASTARQRTAVGQGRLLVERQECLCLRWRRGDGGCGCLDGLTVLDNRHELRARNRASGW